MQTLGVVFTPLNRFSAVKKKHVSHFFKSSLTYFSFIKIGGGHLARFPCENFVSTVVSSLKIVFRSLFCCIRTALNLLNDVSRIFMISVLLLERLSCCGSLSVRVAWAYLALVLLFRGLSGGVSECCCSGAGFSRVDFVLY